MTKGLWSDLPADDLYPAEMRSLNQWVLWKLEYIDGKYQKIPYQITGYRASSTDPKKWTSYESACNALKKSGNTFNGLGFVFTKECGIVFVDVDHCIDEEGCLNEVAQDVIKNITGAFIELSQSETGLHFFTKGEIPEAVKTKEIEMYCSGRFCALTGKIYHKRWTGTLTDETSALMYLYNKYKNTVTKNKDRPVWHSDHSGSDLIALTLADYELLDIAKKNQKFSKLYAGDWSDYDSHSEADLALCVKITFYTGKEPERIDEIFRSSGLYRPKWDKKHFLNGMTYGEHTVMTACDVVEETYVDWRRRVNNERFQKINESFGNLF